MMKIATDRPLYNFIQQPHAFKFQNRNTFSMFNGTAFPVSHMMFISIVSKFNGVGKFLATTFQEQRHNVFEGGGQELK